MWPVLLFAGALCLGQPEPAKDKSPEKAAEINLPVTSPAAPAPPTNPVPPASPAAPPDRWFIMRELQGTPAGAFLDANRLAVYGWTETSFTASSDAHENLPMGFNYKANQFLLQQNWLRIEQAVVTTGTTEPTFGFRSDNILPGSDYRFTLARGIFNWQLTAAHGQPNTYGIDPIQFYGEAYFPTVARGMDVKVGRIFCQYGVETNDAVSNQLASHAYTFIYDPFTHTGVMTTTKLSEAWSFQAGLMLGNDVFIDKADNLTGMGSVKWVSPDKRDSALLSFIVDKGRFDQVHHFHNPEVLDLVYTHTINPRLNYNFEGLFGFTTNVPNIGTAEWFGVLNYLTYAFTPHLSGTTRLEFFDDFQGQRTGFPGLYSVLTAGLSYRPIKDVILRPEVRFDYNDQSRPFENKPYLFTATMDVIVRW
jgi:Putative beta-barrel porin-2, OmpL-like. bbp2